MTDVAAVRRTYPWTTSVDGVRLTFRLMEPSDREAILEFARSLPNDDLIFLRTDITEPKTVDAWINYLKAGRTITVVADDGGKLAGYASIHLNDALWTRHVGELRVLVGRDHRGIGLGKRLTNEAFAIAKDLGLRKITAQMPTEQRGARGVFERLGFRPEALLADHVMSRDGQTHDLLIMSYDVAGFSNEAQGRPRSS
ncbi:MAG TPA: GNAT family N-acetyltransferase [Dehalococcoidia bacterium]|nr:GNAT family N-acetyltransferase [Dehalococcoidia bacterium]